MRQCDGGEAGGTGVDTAPLPARRDEYWVGGL